MSRPTRQRLRDIACGLAVLVAITVSMGATALPSTAKFTTARTTSGNAFAADTVKPVSGLTVTSDNVNELNLSWTASLTTYVTGYKVQRSASASGPWTTLSTIPSRTTTTYTDIGTGMTQWFYRVDAIARNWIGPSAVPQAPVAKGSSFNDGFNGTVPDRDINGQLTEDGGSVWQTIAGRVNDGKQNGAWGAPGVTSVAVVDTPTQDALMVGVDFDGYEAFVIRAKDAKNYIWIGGNGATGSFEVAEVRNGVRTVLKASAPLSTNNNIRIEVIGNTITAYDGATSVSAGGTLLMTVQTSYLLGDPAARLFGVGFTSDYAGIADIKFRGL